MDNIQNLESQSAPNLKKKTYFIILTVLFICTSILTLILINWSLIKLILQKPFALNEQGYSYQITKCWDKNLPTYWLKQTQTNNDGYIKIGKCSFQGIAAIPLVDRGSFNGILNRNLELEGELVRKSLFTYYQITSATPMVVADSPQSNLPKEKLVVKHKTESGEEIVYQRPKNDEHKIIIWQNYLFFEPEQKGDTKEKLIRHNMKTGKTEIVHEDDSGRRSLIELKLIENKLFFSTGGYLAGSDIFYLNKPDSVAKKLQAGQVSFGFSRIEYDGQKYWLKGGEGDACWAIQNLALFDPKTNAVGKTIVSNYGCGDGEELIGYDRKDRMIMADHTMDEKTSEITYNSITIISPSFQTNKKTILLNKIDMPKNVRSVAMSTASGELALAGDNLSLFNFDSRRLDNIIDMPSSSSAKTMYKWQDNKLCISLNSNNSSSEDRYLVDLINKDYKTNDSTCDEQQKNNLTYEESRNQALEQLISTLRLPENYVAVIEKL